MYFFLLSKVLELDKKYKAKDYNKSGAKWFKE